jgi:CheY-like chemotaxis protein
MVKRSLPEEWDVEITFATQGEEAMEALREGKGEFLFLDLTMPVMDGYQVLEAVKREEINTIVIVISADIQPEAQQRVADLGALAFIKKPIDNAKLKATLKKYGLL